MPGKKKPAGPNKSWGDTCQKDAECGEGLACKGGQCETGEKTDGSVAEIEKPCDTASDCSEGETCTAEKVCEAPGRGVKKLWLSASVQPDLSIVTSQDNVCGSLAVVQASNVNCIGEDGAEYTGIPDEGVVGARRGNAIQGGPHLPTVRFLVGVDYLLMSNVSAGARLGYAIGVAPGRSLSSLHAEARATYWFGNNPFKKTSIRPYASVIGGLAEVDDKFDVGVHECVTSAPGPKCLEQKKGAVFPATQTLTVWRRSGGGFAGLAGGAMIPIGSKQGVMAELKVQRFFPNAGIVVSPSIGYAFGF
jgi:hypothetical protein